MGDMLKKIENGDLDEKDADIYLEENEIPMITMDMMKNALMKSSRSVSPAEYLKYLSMKMQFDRESGNIQLQQQTQQQYQSYLNPSTSLIENSNNIDDDIYE